MKKIIKKKLYNTETAEAVGGFSNGLSNSDFRFMEETLYKKKTGEFFLHGHGGAMSRYSEECGDGWAGSEKIMPLSTDEAREWSEQHLDADTYMSLFGTVEE